MLTKTISAEVKDLDEKGQVKFQFAKFEFVDDDKDYTYQGAFAKTMKENLKRIKHFKNHRMDQAPGVIKELWEDQDGAFAATQLILDSTLGRDTYAEYKAGAITEHSYGYDIMKSDPRKEIGGVQDVQGLRELKLWELSSLNAWGASEMTPTLDVKNLKEADADKVIALLEKLEALKRGDFSDEYFKKLEIKIAAVHTVLQSLTEPGDHSEEPVIDLFKHSTLFNRKIA